jgi:dihydrodipicolinate synthase/N-acetylneuraminate lyase
VSATGLSGALPALVTPLTPDRAVDEVDVERLVARAIADGASGVLVAGSTGEGTLLEPEQRVQLTRRARAVVDGAAASGDTGHRATSDAETAVPAVTVIAGVSGATVAALDADIARLADAGADLVLVLAPSTYPLSAEELADLHLGVAERAEVPTLAYHIPQLTGSALTPETVGELAAHPGIVGMKDSSPDAERRTTFIEATRATAGFDVLTGHAPTLRAALDAGASGSITAIANLRQRQLVAFHAAVAAGDTDEAAQAQTAFTRLSDGLAAVGASAPAVLKAALQLDGVVRERWCRPPLRSVGPGRLDRVRTALLA